MDPCFSVINELICRELQEGKYVIANKVPKCVHALGVVSKTDGSFRPVTDCRRPLGASINNFMLETHHPFSYNTVDYVASMMQLGCVL